MMDASWQEYKVQLSPGFLIYGQIIVRINVNDVTPGDVGSIPVDPAAPSPPVL